MFEGGCMTGCGSRCINYVRITFFTANDTYAFIGLDMVPKVSVA